MESVQILVVEDEVLVARDIARMLGKLGYLVPATTVSGEEAVRLAIEHHPQLVLMDIRLRGEMDGVEAARQIRAALGIPIIFLTAHSDEKTLHDAKAVSPAGYLLKPIDHHQLRISVDMALHVYETEKRMRQQERLHQSVLQTALDSFLMLNPAGQVLDVNDAYGRLTGYTRNELLGMTWDRLEKNEQWKSLTACLAAPAGRFESAHLTRDGKEVCVEVSINNLPDQDLIFVFLRDITERKRAEEQILHLNVDLEQRALENRRLYQVEHEHRMLVETLVEASQILSSTLDIDTVLDRILEQVGRIVQNEVSNIVLLDGDETTVVRTRGYEKFDAESFIETFVFPLEGVSIRKHIIKTREPVVVSDVRRDPRWKLSEERAWLRSYVAAPICVQDEVIGLLNVGNPMPGFYNESHGRWLSAFANHAAAAFQNARLFERVQASADRLEFLSRRLLDIQESERRYIARELHDEIGQTLTAARINLLSLRRMVTSADAQGKLKDGLEILELALNQVRNMSLDLRPSMLDDLGLVPALRWYVDREAQWGNLDVQILTDPHFPRMAAELELVCYRIAQEAFTNILRHAHALKATLELKQEYGNCILTISDDGRGFDVNRALQSAGRGQSLGLLGMQERAALVHGSLEIHSRQNDGTTLRVTIPIREELIPEERTI
jgi:PAS domain S-box-containing protein